MISRAYKADALLLLTAFIWGTSFVAQRTGMDHIGPFAFTGVRFMLAALLLLPFALKRPALTPLPQTVKVGTLLGTILFLGASLQQMGIVYTTAGKAGFITGLYVIIVPFLGLFTGLHITRNVWIGAVLATAGLYFLSVQESLTFAPGDFLVFIGAFLWAAHILVIGRVASHQDPFHLATAQFAICGLGGLLVAPFAETLTLTSFQDAAIPIIYSGVLSIALGFTLQIYAQRNAPETHAAIIFSLEAVFAVLAGWAILNESLSSRELLGCTCMLAGMLVAQLFSPKRSSP